MQQDEKQLKKIGERIAEERDRLRKGQLEVAEYCGLSRDMWSRYERGMTAIRENYLTKFAELGADIDFIRTGLRSEEMKAYLGGPKIELKQALELVNEAILNSDFMHLSAEERSLVSAFRSANPNMRAVFLGLVKTEKGRESG
jgi:transcriptional regulator with XRE-family HTH domain